MPRAVAGDELAAHRAELANAGYADGMHPRRKLAEIAGPV